MITNLSHVSDWSSAGRQICLVMVPSGIGFIVATSHCCFFTRGVLLKADGNAKQSCLLEDHWPWMRPIKSQLFHLKQIFRSIFSLAGVGVRCIFAPECEAFRRPPVCKLCHFYEQDLGCLGLANIIFSLLYVDIFLIFAVRKQASTFIG